MSSSTPGKPPTVSIVIPTFNRVALLRRALESVRAQTYTDWEAIIVDDYSEDGTLDMIAGFGDSRLRVEQFHSSGVIAAARNRGIQLARGELIAFLDSDDTWTPVKLERCVGRMTADVDLVAHGLVYLKNGRVWGKKYCGPVKRATFEKLLYDGTCITTSATVVRKSTLEHVNGFIEDPIELVRDFRLGKRSPENPVYVTAEDYDLWLRLAKAGARFAFIREMLGTYYLHAANSSTAIWSVIDSQLAVLDRHFADIPCDSLRERARRARRRALVYYSVARTMQDNGQRVEALKLFWRTLRCSPFVFRIYPAVALTLCRWPPQPPPERKR